LNVFQSTGFRHGLQLCCLGLSAGLSLASSEARADITYPPVCEQVRQAYGNGDRSPKTVSTFNQCGVLPLTCGLKFMALEGTDEWAPAINRCVEDTITGKHTKWSLPRQR
jgi:hypothetical protein